MGKQSCWSDPSPDLDPLALGSRGSGAGAGHDAAALADIAVDPAVLGGAVHCASMAHRLLK